MEEKNRFSNEFKEKLSKDLYKLAEENEEDFKRMIDSLGGDSSDIKVIDRSKFLVDYIPDAMEELADKYGSDFSLDNPEMDRELRELIEKKLHENLPTPKKWNVYYLLLHCKIPRPINIEENIQIMPFGEWPCDDYLNIIEKITAEMGPIATEYSEKTWKTYEDKIRERFEEKNPSGLLVFSNIDAKSRKQAYEKTKDYAESITTCISVLTNSAIETKGWLFEGKLKGLKEVIPDIFFWHYEPIYIDPDRLNEYTKRILKISDDNYLVKLALKYEKEALTESEEKFRMLKRWSALEYISDEYAKKLSSPLLSKEDRNKIIEFVLKEIVKDESPKTIEKVRSGVDQINRKNAKDKVRDLLKWCNYSLKELENNKDVLDVIYQHRNCITHSGGCYKYDETREECKSPSYCKKSDLNMIDLNRELSRMLKAFIGRFIGVRFEYQQEIPEYIKEKYE